MEFSDLIKPVGIIPLDDKVVIRRLKERETTKGGLYLSESAKEKPTYGVVLAAGERVKNSWLHRPVIVTFGKYSGTEIEVDGEKVLLVREDEISALVSDAALIKTLGRDGA